MTQEKIPLDEPEKLIRHIERVAGKAKRSKLQVSTLNNVDYSLGCIAHFLSCTKPQALLFSVILALNFKNRTVGINDLADFMNCNPLTVARYIQDIEILESKRLIHRERDGRKKRAMLHDINFFITREVLDSIYKEDKSCMKNMDGLTMADLLIEVDELMDDRENGRLSYEEMQEDIAMILDQCSHLEFVKRNLRQVNGCQTLHGLYSLRTLDRQQRVMV